MEINWDEVKNCIRTGHEMKCTRKIYLDHLPKRGDTMRINWKECVGYKVPFLYGDMIGEVLIKGYEMNKKNNLTIDIVRFNEIEFEIHTDSFRKCQLGSLINNVYANRNLPNRQLIINSTGENEAKRLTISSDKKVDIVCPYCGDVKSIKLNDLYKQGFSCSVCGDGLSYPEKFMRELLKKQDVKFIQQFSLDGGKSKYDFYLPDYHLIIETHGRQHYREMRRKRSRTLKEEQENDLYKKLNALTWGYNYIVIDCSHSSPEFIKDNIISSGLLDILNVDKTNINWVDIGSKAENSLMIEICNYFNINGGSTYDIGDVFYLSRTTIGKYLNRGAKLGLCKYDGKENEKTLNSKSVVKIDLYGNLICKYANAYDAKRELGYNNGNINACCNYHKSNLNSLNNRKNNNHITAYGFIWMFEFDYIALNGDKSYFEKIKSDVNSCTTLPKKVVCINTGEVFDSLIMASEYAGLKSNSSISECLSGRNKSAGRHPETRERLKWMYYDDRIK